MGFALRSVVTLPRFLFLLKMCSCRCLLHSKMKFDFLYVCFILICNIFTLTKDILLNHFSKWFIKFILYKVWHNLHVLMFTCLHLYMFTCYMSICLLVYMYICLLVYMFIWFTCLHVHMYTCLHVHMFTCLHVHMVYLFTCSGLNAEKILWTRNGQFLQQNIQGRKN